MSNRSLTGIVYTGFNIANRKEVAIKLESFEADEPLLEYESYVYRALAGGTGIPHLLWTGADYDYNIMAMELLGPSLEDLFNLCGRKFTVKTVLLLSIQIVSGSFVLILPD